MISDSIHLGYGWYVVFACVAVVNLFLAVNYWRLPYAHHARAKRLALLGTHVFLSLCAILYFYRYFHGQTGTPFVNVLRFFAALQLGLVGYGFFLFVLYDLFRLARQLICKIRKKPKARPLPAKAGVCVLTGALLLTIIAFFPAQKIVLTSYEITLPQKDSDIESLRVVLFADAHIGVSVNQNNLTDIVRMVNEQAPDIVVLAGDIFDEGTTDEEKEAAAKAFLDIEARLGVYYIIGNHDDYMGQTEKQIAYFEAAGIKPLVDETLLVDGSFYLIGRKDGPKVREDLAALLMDVEEDYPVIVVDHRPTMLSAAESAEVDLQLSGHTHNGQFYPAQLFQGSTPHVHYGLHRAGETDYIVTSGVGTYGVPLRLGSHCEIVRIDITFE